ncbi:hypothetical protein FHR49_000094 [Xanthomonas campestris]
MKIFYICSEKFLVNPEREVSRDVVVAAIMSFGLGGLFCYAATSSPLQFFAKFTPTDWAAWVQAVGSVAAICVAILVPVALHLSAQMRSERAELLERQSVKYALLDQVTELEALFRLVKENVAHRQGKECALPRPGLYELRSAALVAMPRAFLLEDQGRSIHATFLFARRVLYALGSAHDLRGMNQDLEPETYDQLLKDASWGKNAAHDALKVLDMPLRSK